MANTITIPFYAFKLHLRPGVHLLTPLTDAQAVRLSSPVHSVARQYAGDLQSKVLNRGGAASLLDEYRPGEFFRDTLRVTFPAARDGVSYPAFEIEFDYFFSQREHGYWAILPALALEAFAQRSTDLPRRLEETVRLNFARHQRLNALQEVISTIWYESMEMLQQEITLQIPSPREVDERQESPPEQWLPRVAQRLEIDRQVTYGRENELQQVERALKNEFSRNLLLVGPSGSGKTALIWEIARQARDRGIEGDIWETTASLLIKELTRQTGWQDNLAFLCQELANTRDLLFVRNLAELFEVGKYEGNELAIGDYLRSYLSRGEITIISECTGEELSRIELRSPNYLAMFQVIRMEEPGPELEQIILDKIGAMARARKVEITPDAIREVIRLNRRFLPYSGMPGKPIRFLESMLISEKGLARISRADVIRHFCEESGMPPSMIDPALPMEINAVKERFNTNVFGQEQAVDIVVGLLASVKTALTRTGKPIASLLFVGPTGVGKTELAKVLAEFMFGSRDRLVRFDMSEFSSPFAVMRLIGTTYFSDGLLTSAVRREPFCVLLFDEIEKAHSNFYDLLLQLLSEGRLTDSQGKLVNFCSTIVIMTSNIGAESMQNQTIGWSHEQPAGEVRERFLQAVRRHFRPELFNRIDQIIPFDPLDRLTIRYVVERELDRFHRREGVRFRRLHLDIDDKVLDFLGERGYDGRYGARHLQRTIREELVLPLARRLNAEDPDDRLVLHVRMEADDRPGIHVEADPLGLELLLEELDKINHADHAGVLRRRAHQLQEGAYFLELSNTLEQLESRKERKKRKFWDNLPEAKQYTCYLETREKVKSLTADIEAIEQQLSLAALGLEVYQPEIVAGMEEWDRRFHDLMVELYSRLTPQHDRCTIGVYGSDVQEPFAFYADLLRQKGFSFSVRGVWFREAYYNEEIVTPAPPGEEERRHRRAEYISTGFHAEKVDLSALPPPAPGDLLYGVELGVEGPGAFLYLKEEEGIQRWAPSAEDEKLFVVRVESGSMTTPDRIHRREFYRTQSPRRTVGGNILRDNLYQINREVDPGERVAYLVEHLDRRFKAKLNLEMM